MLKNNLKLFKPLLPLAFVVLLSSGCSYFDKPDPASGQIDLMAEDAVEQVPAREPITFDDIAQASSNKDVQLFSLDGAPVNVLAPASSASGRSTLSNPSVEVFPLDGGLVPAPVALQPVSSSPAAAPVTPVDVAPSSPSTSGVTRIFFSHDSSSLNAQDEALLRNVSTTVGGRPIKVVGHASSESSVADPIRRKMVNLRKSLDRAYAVSKSLIGKGVPAEQIETIGVGENVPAANSASARRVEISAQ